MAKVSVVVAMVVIEWSGSLNMVIVSTMNAPVIFFVIY